MENQDIKNEVVLKEDQIICALTNNPVKATEKELNLQSMILMMAEEYNFALEDIQRDFRFRYEDEEGKKKNVKVDLAIFEKGRAHDVENLIRVVVVAKDGKVKPTDAKNGAEAILEPILLYTKCDFALWTNGEDMQYMHCVTDDIGQETVEDLSDFPAEGQTLDDLIVAGEKGITRKPANESLVRTFKRCHDYIYGNEGMKKDAFWELLNLIFCKLYDEKRRFMASTESYRRKFWVGVKELNTPEGQKAVATRIKNLFEELKANGLYSDVFDGSEILKSSDRGLAFVASELSKYSFLDATVDVKGTAYETIVSNTLKQEAGQFFTPRNIIKCMVEMLDPDVDTRILDPACGSGGFLVMALDHVRKKIAKRCFPEDDDLHLAERNNTPQVNELVREYAETKIFGFDFDIDLKKASRMNMVMSGDGHANIFNINSLEYPNGSKPDVPKVGEKVKWSILKSKDKDNLFDKDLNHAFGKFDMIFTNPPFGSNVEVDADIAKDYELYEKSGSKAPEVLFIEQCYHYLKPGGKMAIVLPDGILGNPNMLSVRQWILSKFKILASVDLPVETFLPQVGVQASLLFLQKKTSQEQLISYEQDDYDVFMAIVDKVGKDRRGVPIYKKDEDGAELLFEHIKRWIAYTENGHEMIRSRKERIKLLDDDLPEVAKAYQKFKEEHGL